MNIRRTLQHNRTFWLCGLGALAIFTFGMFQNMYAGFREDRFTHDIHVRVEPSPGADVDLIARTAGGERRAASRDGSGGSYVFRDTLVTGLSFSDAIDGGFSVVVRIGGREYPSVTVDAEGRLQIDRPLSALPLFGPIYNVAYGRMLAEGLASLAALCLVALGLWVLRRRWPEGYSRAPIFPLSAVILSISALLPLGLAVLTVLSSAGVFAVALQWWHPIIAPQTSGHRAWGSGLGKRAISVGASVLLILLAANVFIGLERRPFHQDENLHVSAAQGLRQTGDYVLWDFLLQEPRRDYTRNFEYTTIVAYMFDLFGIGERPARVPNALLSVVLAAALALFMWRVTRSGHAVLLILYIISVNDVVIYFARFVRGYMILMTLTFVSFAIMWWLAERERSIRRAVLLLVAAVLVFLLSIRFHATAVFQVPFIVVAVLGFLQRRYPLRRYGYIYAGALAFAVALAATALGMVPFIDLPFSPASHVDLSVDLSRPNFAYFSHALQPFNVSWHVLAFLSIAAVWTWRSYPHAMAMLIVGVFAPLLASVYFFDRYEDFRYISVIQPLVIVLFALSLREVIGNALHWWSAPTVRLPAGYRVTAFGAITLAMLLAIAPLQIPGFAAEDGAFVRTAQADWRNIEGKRIHRRAAQPDNYSAFDYMFDSLESDTLRLVRVQDDGINWLEDYYLSQYLEEYPHVGLNYYRLQSDGELIHEYSLDTRRTDTPESLGELSRPYFVIASIPGRITEQDRRFLDTQGRDVSSEAGIVRGRYGSSADESVQEYFPHLWYIPAGQGN